MRTSRDEWKKRVERWKDSGLSAEEFAAELGINASTLKFWKYQLGKGERRGRGSAPRQHPKRPGPELPLMEVRPSLSPGAPGFELELAGGKRLRIPTAFESEALTRLLAVLERMP